MLVFVQMFLFFKEKEKFLHKDVNGIFSV